MATPPGPADPPTRRLAGSPIRWLADSLARWLADPLARRIGLDVPVSRDPDRVVLIEDRVEDRLHSVVVAGRLVIGITLAAGSGAAVLAGEDERYPRGRPPVARFVLATAVGGHRGGTSGWL